MKLFLFIIALVELFVFISAEKNRFDTHNDDDGHSNYAVHRKM